MFVIFRPLVKPFVVKHFYFIRNDKRNNVITQAFFEQDEPPDTPVPVLERLAFKAVFQHFYFYGFPTVGFSDDATRRGQAVITCPGRHFLTIFLQQQ